MKRIDHQEAYSLDGACTNWAESYFTRLRRGEVGHHHHISGPYLLRYAQESAWREDNRRVANGEQVQRVAKLALGRKKSVDFSGYWQRHKVEPKAQLKAGPKSHEAIAGSMPHACRLKSSERVASLNGALARRDEKRWPCAP